MAMTRLTPADCSKQMLQLPGRHDTYAPWWGLPDTS